MFPTVSLGPLSLQTSGLILLAAVYFGLWLSEKQSAHFKIAPDTPYNLAFIAMLAVLIGGRLFFALAHASLFLASPASSISPDLGLINWPAGLLIGAVSLWIYGQKKALPFWRTLDMLTPALAVTSAGMALANLASGKAFGAPTTLPWGIFLWGETRHPTQIYAFLAAGGVLLYVLRRLKTATVSGTLFLEFAAWTSGWVLLVAAFRGDSLLLPGGIRQTQVLAWLCLAISLWLLYRRFSSEA